eukprot:gene4675-4929_t
MSEAHKSPVDPVSGKSIKGFQDRAIAKNPVKVRKSVKLGKAKAVLLAPNIEQMEAEGGLTDSVDDILASCTAAEVPVVFALSRKKMGEVYGFRKRMSAIAVLEVGGVQDVFETVLQLADEGQARWQAAHPAGEESAPPGAVAVAEAAASAVKLESSVPVAPGPVQIRVAGTGDG